MTPLVARGAFALCAVAVMASVAATSDMCKGDTPPPVPILLASPKDPANTAWIRGTDCWIELISLSPAANGDLYLNCSDRKIGSFESLPSAIQWLDLDDNPVPNNADFSTYPKLNRIALTRCNLTTVDHFKFSSTLQTLDLAGNQLPGIANGTIPDSVQTLHLGSNGLHSMADFSLPNSLTALHLENNLFTSIDFPLPAGLEEIHMDGNAMLQVLENVTMPNTLMSFTCANCGVETFRGVQISSGLRTLNLTGSTLKEFEVKATDVIALKRAVFSGTVNQQTCKDNHAQLQVIPPSLPACVIPDDVFAAKYLGSSLPSPSTAPLSTATPPSSLPVSPSSSSSSSSPSKTTLVIIIEVVAAVCVALGVLAYRKWHRKRSVIDDKYRSASTAEAPVGETSDASQDMTPDIGSNDIRNDETFIAYRIAYNEIQIVRLIGKGACGIVHLGLFRGQDVAVKQIVPGRARDMDVLHSFMDEIRLCVTLEHPRIVQFIGLMWSTLQDVAVVSEYMAGGDLRAALDRQPGSSPSEWFEPSANLKAKSSLALDVIVALVYLHSFDHPIIHRDLKARNVLLNNNGDAKLTDFGTSREALPDETMTGEIGTVAWIAPEVLRGERYNEKADIYSLGVLLVELDTARHPYRKKLSDTDSSLLGNAQIALSVSTGRLVPAPSRECASDIAPLITKCLSCAPQDRPSAMEIHYELRQVLRQHLRWSHASIIAVPIALTGFSQHDDVHDVQFTPAATAPAKRKVASCMTLFDAGARRVLLLLGVVTAVMSRLTSAAMCDALSRPAPPVLTVMAAPNDTARTAWILQPNCTLEIVALEPDDDGAAKLDCSERQIDRIESLPSAVERLYFDSNGVTQADFTKYPKLKHIILAWCELSKVDGFQFPASLRELDFEGNRLEGIANGVIPSHVEILYLGENSLDSLANFSLPTSLSELYLQGNAFSSLNFVIPDGLNVLHMNDNAELKTIENVTMPTSLRTLSCAGCGLQSFRGVELSPYLKTLNFSGVHLTDFEVRESDVGILEKVTFVGDVALSACQDTRATVRHLQPKLTACVLSDANFAAKYSRPTTSPSPDASDSSSSSSTVIIIVAVVAGLVCLAIAVVIYRKCFRSKTSALDDNTDDKYQDATTLESSAPTVGSGSASLFAPHEYLSNDIRNDDALMTFRIPYDEIHFVRVLATGGFGVIHLATYRHCDVAVKLLRPEKANDTSVVRSFMDEIRLCASLDHPRIVAFVGVMWSKLRDVAVAIEYMAGGDLHTVLRSTQTPTSSTDQWFAPSVNLKAKRLLALDVIDALVYLHSLDPSIIHRDLKARNVLLNDDGDAKLSDFGISREVQLDETMTGEIGTVAWIAPEVLRGERYTEKADIYSLGVLLVELDTARHPYAREISSDNATPQTNTRIALLVSTGKLAPSPSPACPPDIAALIAACLSFDPEHRPSAMHLHYELRQLNQRRLDEATGS